MLDLSEISRALSSVAGRRQGSAARSPVYPEEMEWTPDGWTYNPGRYDPNLGRWVSDEERRQRAKDSMLSQGPPRKLPGYGPVDTGVPKIGPYPWPTDHFSGGE